MTRKILVPFITAIVFLFASATFASPPPNVTFIFHNNTGQTVPGASVLCTYKYNSSSGTAAATVGTVANGATASASFGMTFDQNGIQTCTFNTNLDGSTKSSYFPAFYSSTWGNWSCTNCPYTDMPKWADYNLDYFIKKR